ncbi:MAG: hypothetical protein QNJ29_10260 [Rhizobiaceae bacterium]|nr:hypothetical protein [Rhizobiaceae bacterium]
MTDQPLIALEIHDRTLWEPGRVLPMIDAMERWGYNALVLHQNDLLDICTQLFLSANYGVADLRLKKVRNAVAWLNRLVERLARFDAKLFLEIKEPSLHDYVLEQYPELIGSNGAPDPAKSQWFEFCSDKTEDLLRRVPGLGGLIINISSPESRVSLPDYLATSGIEMDVSDWFDRMIASFHAPLAAAGKQLYVRDFSYTADMQSEVLSAVNRKHGEVGASVKITAHDYFPGYPENPVARMVPENVILEFEAFGEHMGWGVIPNCRVEEFRKRMFGYREMCASGFLMRTSWEAITGANALDSLSAVNVYALPRLLEQDVPAETVVTDWLDQEFNVSGDVALKLTDILLQSWHVCAGSYWDDQVFPRHSCLPSTWQEGWVSMETNGMGNRSMDTAIDPADRRLSEEARVELFAAKKATSLLACELQQKAAEIRNELPSVLAEKLSAFDYLPEFAKQFELATKATFYAARSNPDDRSALAELHSDFLHLADKTEQLFDEKPDAPHHHKMLLDPAQMRLFADSLPMG